MPFSVVKYSHEGVDTPTQPLRVNFKMYACTKNHRKKTQTPVQEDLEKGTLVRYMDNCGWHLLLIHKTAKTPTRLTHKFQYKHLY
jgi:hypothetical protein